MTGSLVIVGVGISGVQQITPEAAGYMQQAGQLFYMVLDPLTEVWLRSVNPTATSLHDSYAPGKPRRRTYDEMTRRITAAVESGQRVCVAFYGHPSVLVYVTQHAVRAVKRLGRPVKVVPGISAEACLYADLQLDPGVSGVQSFEATDFLLNRRRSDPTSALILWQIGVLGDTTTRDPNEPANAERLSVLVRRLLRDYPRRHRVVVYEAAMFPGRPPRITRVALSTLGPQHVRPISTMYVPPLKGRPHDPAIARWMQGA